ncbi:MAG: phytoene/squalene synthase family protein [Myxococcota bacterium]
MTALVATGYAQAKAVTRRHAKSFFFSSVALWGQRRRSAFALYSFCRRLDDLVDGDNTGDGVVSRPTALPSQLRERLELARASVRALYGRESRGVFRELPWSEAELAAFRDTVERYRVPEEPFQELISGMEMDVVKSRYATFDELKLYCYRVAGVVGLMMTPVLGYRDERCLPYAADLGTAMQLTNILRDVREDWARGRVYLPADELASFGLDEAVLSRGEVSEAWRAFMRFQLTRARSLYARAALGVPELTGFGSQAVVRLMGAVYGGILDVIEERDFDVFSSRASVPFRRKLALAFSALSPVRGSGRDGSRPREKQQSPVELRS